MSENNDHELLVQMAGHWQNAEKHRRIIVWATLAILVLLIITFLLIVPRAVSLMNAADSSLTRINDLLDKAEPAVDGMNKIDYDALNKSITDLSGAISSLSGLFH
jgi:type II secretory pathway component PulM